MIPALYSDSEKNFSSNGLGLLKDCISCKTMQKRNGSYELELTYPVGSFLYEEIKCQRIIKAKANNRYSPQLFRIYYISKPINGLITVKAEHISYRLKDNFIEKIEFSGNCGGALNMLDSLATFRSGFNFNSDISSTSKVNLERINFWNAIVGTRGSIIDVFGNGADIVRDNFNISVKAHGGLDNNVLIAYKKNLSGFECEEDWTDCITKIYPYAIKDDVVYTISEKYVDSKYIIRDENPKIASIDFSSRFEEDSEITETKLRTLAENYFKNNNCDIPSLKYKVEFVELSKTEEYKTKGFTEEIELLDKVIIRHDLYNIDTKIKVISDNYDSLSEKYIKLELGTQTKNLSDLITDINNEIEDSQKDKVTIGFLDKAIEDLSNAITGNDGGYVRLNPPSNPSEILIMDTEDILTAKTVWRWNKEGLGVSLTGYNGSFMGLAKNGKLVIEEATVNKINAALIKAGTLISLNNKTWINMDDGTFNFANKIKFIDDKLNITLTNGKDIETNLEQLSTQISSTITKNEFGSLVQQNYDSVAIAIKNKTNSQAVFDSNGLTIENGKFKINKNGKVNLYIDTNGYLNTQSGLRVVDTETTGQPETFISDLGISMEFYYSNTGDLKTTELNPERNGIRCNNSFFTDGGIDVEQDLWVGGDFDVSGSKHCVQSTKNYGKVLFNAYETPGSYFGDIGRARLDESGICIIYIDDFMQESINTKIEYEVFTSIYEGELDKTKAVEFFEQYFILHGTPNALIGWEIKGKRIGYENIRIEEKQDYHIDNNNPSISNYKTNAILSEQFFEEDLIIGGNNDENINWILNN